MSFDSHNSEDAIVSSESTLTDRYQTTIPEVVRKALKLQKRDKVTFTVNSSGFVSLAKSEPEARRDPVIASFLEFLSSDIEKHPEKVVPLTTDLLGNMEDIVGDIDVDLDSSLDSEDD